MTTTSDETLAPERAAAGHGEADETSEATSDLRQYVTFMTGGELFAVEMAPVLEIIRVPETVRVPMAPPALEGLANLRGKVLPIVSLRYICGFPEQAHDDASRALVIDLGQPLGFVVDRVVSVLGVDPGSLEPVDGMQGTVNTELLSGIIKDVGGHPMIMVLDFAKLIEREFSDVGAVAAKHTAGRTTVATEESEDDGATTDELQLVSFDVAAQEYAISIDHVQEIVPLPETIVRVPHAESHVLGLMTLRQRVLPLVSLRRMFALADRDADEQSRVVVVSLGASSVGIVMDAVNEVLRVPTSAVDAMPGLFARDGSMAEISQLCRLDDGTRLVSIISVGHLFRHSAIQEALTAVEQHRDSNAEADALDDAAHEDDEQFVVFRLDREEFGVPIDSVQEIVRVPEELTRVPGSPGYVEGVINLRGTVLPVIDLRGRLGLPTVERTDGQRVMVFLIAGTCTGFIVDAVAEVLRIARSAIEPAPRLSGAQGDLLARMANLPAQKRMVQLIAPAHLLGDGEVADLTALSA